jgi:chromosome segregation ATPase
MDGAAVEYRSPKHVQILFLKRSRNKLRAKYRDLKDDQKRLQNRVRDVAKSREDWRRQAEELQAANEQLAQENAELREDIQLKKRASFFRPSE